MKGSRLIIILSLFGAFTACKSEEEIKNERSSHGYNDERVYTNLNVDPEDSEWLENSDRELTLRDFIRSKEVELSKLKIKASWVPKEYYIIKDLKTNDPEVIEKELEKLEGEEVFEIEFSKNGVPDLFKDELKNYSGDDIVKKMSFGMTNDLYLVVEKDTIRCESTHFERDFNVSQSKKIMAYFSKVPNSGDMQLVYHDRLFKRGIVKFKFKKSELTLNKHLEL